MSLNMTMVWTITFRTDSASPQKELKRYTRESANNFAQGIIDTGGVAIVTEDIEDIPQQTDDSIPHPHGLIWSDK